MLVDLLFRLRSASAGLRYHTLDTRVERRFDANVEHTWLSPKHNLAAVTDDHDIAELVGCLDGLTDNRHDARLA